MITEQKCLNINKKMIINKTINSKVYKKTNQLKDLGFGLFHKLKVYLHAHEVDIQPH